MRTWPPMTQPIPHHCLTHWVSASHRFIIGSSNKLTAMGLWNIFPPKDVEYLIANSQQDSTCCFLVLVDRNPSKPLVLSVSSLRGIADAALCGLPSNRYPSQPQQIRSPTGRKRLIIKQMTIRKVVSVPLEFKKGNRSSLWHPTSKLHIAANA